MSEVWSLPTTLLVHKGKTHLLKGFTIAHNIPYHAVQLKNTLLTTCSVWFEMFSIYTHTNTGRPELVDVFLPSLKKKTKRIWNPLFTLSSPRKTSSQ